MLQEPWYPFYGANSVLGMELILYRFIPEVFMMNMVSHLNRSNTCTLDLMVRGQLASLLPNIKHESCDSFNIIKNVVHHNNPILESLYFLRIEKLSLYS